MRGTPGPRALGLAAAAALLLGGAAAAQEPPAPTTTFQVTIINTTPDDREITRGAWLVHDEPHAFWEAGGQANQATEDIAEFALTGAALEQLGATEIPRLPTRGDSLTFELRARPGQLLSTVQMFARTNDAFLGLESLPLFDESGAPIGTTVRLEGWDSGTEENTFETTGYDGLPNEEPIHLHPDFPGTQAVITVEPYDPLLVGAGGMFRAWLGPDRDVAEVFGQIDGVSAVWRWHSGRWQAWSLSLPESLRESFVLGAGDVLFVVADRFVVVPV